MNKLFAALLCLLLVCIAWLLYNWYDISQTEPYRNLPQERNLEPAALANELEKYLSTATPAPEDLLLFSDIHIHLATYYAALGEKEKAQQHLNQVLLTHNKVKLLAPYVAGMWHAAEQGKMHEIIEVISKRHIIEEKAENIGFIDEGSGTRHLDLNAISRNLCLTASKILGGKGEYELLQNITELPPCDIYTKYAGQYELGGMLTSGKYRNAYEYAVEHTEIDPKNLESNMPPVFLADPTRKVIVSCLKEADVTDTDLSSLELYALRIPDDDRSKPNSVELYLLATILTQAGATDAAFDLLPLISDDPLHKDILFQLYEKFYLQDNYEKTLTIADRLNISAFGKPEYVKENGFINISRVWYESPASLAYELALKIDDDRTRFNALLGIYNRSDDLPFPGCEMPAWECVANRLQEIAHNNTVFSDPYYAKITELYLSQADNDNYQLIYGKITKPENFLCREEPCRGKLIEPHDIDKVDCQEQRPSDLTDFPQGAQKIRISNLAKCHFKNDVYKEVLTDWQQNLKTSSYEWSSYFAEIAFLLAKQNKTDDMIGFIKAIPDPILRGQAFRNAWWHYRPVFPISTTLVKENETGYLTRKVLLDNFLNDPLFEQDRQLWTAILGDTEYPYWQMYDRRLSLSRETEEEWRTQTWDLVDIILGEMPMLELGKCYPARFEIIYKECAIRRLIARQRPQEAMNFSRDKKDIMYAISLVIQDRLYVQNSVFRNIAADSSQLVSIKDMDKNCPHPNHK